MKYIKNVAHTQKKAKKKKKLLELRCKKPDFFFFFFLHDFYTAIEERIGGSLIILVF